MTDKRQQLLLLEKERNPGFFMALSLFGRQSFMPKDNASA